MGSENASVKTLAAAIHAALAAAALVPKFVVNPDVNVGVMINSTLPRRQGACSLLERPSGRTQMARSRHSFTSQRKDYCRSSKGGDASSFEAENIAQVGLAMCQRFVIQMRRVAKIEEVRDVWASGTSEHANHRLA